MACCGGSNVARILNRVYDPGIDPPSKAKSLARHGVEVLIALGYSIFCPGWAMWVGYVTFIEKVWEPGSRRAKNKFRMHRILQKRKKSVPPRLSDPRPGRVSICDDGPKTGSLLQQEQCLFLSRVPKDVRLMIYDLLLGCPDRSRHIAIMARRLGGNECWEPEAYVGWKHRCWGSSNSDGTCRGRLLIRRSNLLALPLTCHLL